MTLQSPDALSPALAIRGGQFAGHGPVQALAPLPATSLSKVYSVMPFSPTRLPPSVLAGAASARQDAPSISAAAPFRTVSARVSYFTLILHGVVELATDEHGTTGNYSNSLSVKSPSCPMT